jgi:glycosyltransferase involved in cell wall biosynthesis
MTAESPKISLITVCYNSAKTLQDTFDSVASQTYPNIEYIVVDGNSRDETLTIIEANRHLISKFISEPDKGLWDAMNKGINLATGQYIGFINSDDFLTHRNVVQELLDLITVTNSDGAFGYVDIVSQHSVEKLVRKYRIKRLNALTLRIGLMPAHPGMLIHRDFFEKFGCFSLDVKRYAPDFEMLARFHYKGNLKLARISEPVVQMRDGGDSNQGNGDRIRRISLLVNSCRDNGLYTNSLLMLLKVPIKAMEYISTYLRRQ